MHVASDLARRLVGHFICGAVASSLVVHLGATQALTIPQRLSAAGKSLVGSSSIPSGISPSIEEVAARSDLLVVATLGSSTAYLSADQTEVRTRYSLLDPKILVAREKVATPSTFSVVGGEIEIQGLTYTQVFAALPALAAGTHVILLLKSTDDGYTLAGMHYGIFAVTDGKTQRLTRKDTFAPELQGEDESVTLGRLVNACKRAFQGR